MISGIRGGLATFLSELQVSELSFLIFSQVWPNRFTWVTLRFVTWHGSILAVPEVLIAVGP